MTISGLSEVRKKAWETRRAKYGNRGYAKQYAKPGWNEAIDEASRVIAEQRCERGTPWDLALVTALEKVRSLKIVS